MEDRSGPRSQPVQIGQVRLGGDAPLALIAGPCVIESRDHCLMMAEKINKVCQRSGVPLIFKSSYDKANRSSVRSYRGPGIDEGLRVLDLVRHETGIPVLGDVHAVDEVTPAAQALDAIQIPAFLCRQTDLLLAAGKSGKPVNVKKGQFMAPWEMGGVVEKLESVDCREMLLTERGSSFGHEDLVVDFRAFPAMRQLGYPVAFDATHGAAKPPGADLGPSRTHVVRELAQAAAAANVDALFIEVHHAPAEAMCDREKMIDLTTLSDILPIAVKIARVVRSHAQIQP